MNINNYYMDLIKNDRMMHSRILQMVAKSLAPKSIFRHFNKWPDLQKLFHIRLVLLMFIQKCQNICCKV